MDLLERHVFYNRGASRCFGFVTFEQKETVELLVQHNNYKIKGKLVDVKQALPKSLQKVQNIRCQSAVDNLLNKHKKTDDVKMKEMLSKVLLI